MGEQINLFLQSSIDRDLPVRVIGAVEQCQPTAQVLLDGDDGGGQRIGLDSSGACARDVQQRSFPQAPRGGWYQAPSRSLSGGLAFAILPAQT